GASRNSRSPGGGCKGYTPRPTHILYLRPTHITPQTTCISYTPSPTHTVPHDIHLCHARHPHIFYTLAPTHVIYPTYTYTIPAHIHDTRIQYSFTHIYRALLPTCTIL